MAARWQRPEKGGSSPTGQPQAAAASADMEQYSSDCVLPPMNHKHDDYIHGGDNWSGPFGYDFLFSLFSFFSHEKKVLVLPAAAPGA